jgi:hypothetical protein
MKLANKYARSRFPFALACIVIADSNHGHDVVEGFTRRPRFAHVKIGKTNCPPSILACYVDCSGMSTRNSKGVK